MVIMISKLQLKALFFFMWILESAFGSEDLLSCEATAPAASGYHCDQETGSQNRCKTYAVLCTNPYYSSLSNLSYYLAIDRSVIAEANGFSADTEFLPSEQPLLIPIECKCSGAFFEAKLTKFTIKGESFYGISQALEGLTTCKAIREKNPSISSPWDLAEKLHLVVPLRCACPSSIDISHKGKFLLTYPVSVGDTLANLANEFNTTPQSIISASNRSGSADFRPESLLPFSTLLIPLEDKPIPGSLAKPRQLNWGYPITSIPAGTHPRKRKSKMRKMGIYIALSGVAFAISIGIAAAFLIIRWRRKKNDSCKTEDVELQQLNLSIRTVSEKKVSFDGSQDTLDGQILDSTPHKTMVEIYTLEQLKKATEDFNSTNLIGDSVFHGRLNGKNLAIKRTGTEIISKIDIGLLYDAIHHHPNIIRLYGTCVTEGPDSYLVFEFAKNGSLKDWLHGGLAMKNQFIASCYCFLTWNQRLKICLDVATALQFMHHIMSPGYVHRNIKSRNIFLDEDFHAKVGNFGMARCVEDDADDDQESHPSQFASWSKGYIAPEYIQHGAIAPSIDIFAYGVVLLEVLSGKTAITWAKEKEENKVIRLSERIKLILQSENADELREWMDNALGEKYSFDTAVTLANLARACVEDDPSSRPNAGEIVDKLSRLVQDLPQREPFIISESSCKPLVMAAANNM